MLPIEPVFQDISRVTSSSDHVILVDVPDLLTISLLRSSAPTHSSAASSLKFDLTPSPSHRITTIVRDEARSETYSTANVVVPVAPTREAPAPPTTRRPSIAGVLGHTERSGDLTPRNTHILDDTVVPDPIVELNDESRIRIPLRSRIQYGILYPLKLWTASAAGSVTKWLKSAVELLAFIGIVIFLLGSFAGPGYLIYYIVKKTSLPLYAKILASIATGFIPSTIPTFWYAVLIRRRRMASLAYDLGPQPPPMGQLDPSWPDPSAPWPPYSVESDSYGRSRIPNPIVELPKASTVWLPQPVEPTPYNHSHIQNPAFELPGPIELRGMV